MWYDQLGEAWIELHQSFTVPLTDSEEEWFEVFKEDDEIANEA